MPTTEEFDDEADVIVAGTGCGGSAAALGAYYAGAKKVILLEKSNKLYGGTTALAGGGWLWCPNNRFLKQIGVQQHPQEIYSLIKALAYPTPTSEQLYDQSDLDLMNVFAYEWPAIIETMQKENFIKLQCVEVRDPDDDIKFTEKLLQEKVKKNPKVTKEIGVADNIDKLKHFMPSYCAHHDLDLCPTGKVLSPNGGTTSGLLQKSVKRHGDVIELRMNSQITDIIFDSSGKKVAGAVVYDNKTKTLKRIKARNGVIFATGGFSSSVDKKKTYFEKYQATFYGTCAAKTNTGDFIDICEKYNFELSGMDLGWFKQVVIPQSRNRFSGVFFLNADSFICVNNNGRRFANEKDFYQQRGLQMLENPQELHCVFHIYDERCNELHAGPIKSMGGPIPFEGNDEDCTVSASSVEELTEKLKGLMKAHLKDKNFQLSENFASNLKLEIDKFNAFAKAGIDRDFHRGEDAAKTCWHTVRRENPYPSKTMYPIDVTKLKVLMLGLSTLDTKGGPRINKNGQVYKRFSTKEVVDGLYGCGNCVRSWTQQSYPASGSTMASAICFGFKSGMHAMNHNIKL